MISNRLLEPAVLAAWICTLCRPRTVWPGERFGNVTPMSPELTLLLTLTLSCAVAVLPAASRTVSASVCGPLLYGWVSQL